MKRYHKMSVRTSWHKASLPAWRLYDIQRYEGLGRFHVHKTPVVEGANYDFYFEKEEDAIILALMCL
jgi:hypothetical protein